MHPSLFIQRRGPNDYEAMVLMAGEELGPRTQHDTVASAIAYAGNVAPREFYRFMDVYLGSASIGTQSTVKMTTQADSMAAQLVSVVSLLELTQTEMEAGAGGASSVFDEILLHQRSLRAGPT